VKPGDDPPRGDTDWARLKAKTDEEVMAAALADPDAQPLTPEQLAKMRRVSRVKVLRQRLGMTQVEFAQAFTCRSRRCAIGSSIAACRMRRRARSCSRSNATPRSCDACWRTPRRSRYALSADSVRFLSPPNTQVSSSA
jgi:hypothetical protein